MAAADRTTRARHRPPAGNPDPGAGGEFRHERVADPRSFDPASFRTVTLGDGHRVVVGCPRGRWQGRAPRGARCQVGMQVQAILHPKDEAHCANPLLALINPPQGTQRMATAVYEIVYQHARDPEHGPGRKHVFDQPENVELYVLNDYQVLLQARHAPLLGWFD